MSINEKKKEKKFRDCFVFIYLHLYPDKMSLSIIYNAVDEYTQNHL